MLSLALAAVIGCVRPASAASAGFDGASLSLIWCIPFAGLLLSIALMPLLAPRFWHHHFGKISAFWAVCLLAPLLLLFGPSVALEQLLHTLLLEYVPFIILLLALFTVTGGLQVKMSAIGTPGFNTGLLAVGTVLAGWMGTTGASMLLIRPLLRANAWRQQRVHVVVFFIFLVSNIGGSITPLGDPPLFLGFLNGVPFFWPTVHLVMPTLVVALPLLLIFYLLDRWYMQHERQPPAPEAGMRGIRLEGSVNLLLLGGIVAAVLMSGTWRPSWVLNIHGIPLAAQNIARDLLLLAIAGLSLSLTSKEAHAANEFTWGPISEVAKLFAGIFLTIIPVIAIVRAGQNGALGVVVEAVTRADGTPNEAMYFWITGILSSFLDNAPTYLVFFNTAGGDPALLTGPLQQTLVAISCGAVFMGANTYIGNAPNFMVRAIAEESGVRMPSFFGYFAWAVLLLLPLFAVVTAIFFR